MECTFLHRISVLFVFLFSFQGIGVSQPRYQVNLFVLEDCKITQAYIPDLRKIYSQFQCDSIQFTAYFSNPSSELASVQEFVKRYQLPIPFVMDTDQQRANTFDITVMPEVVVFDNLHQLSIYQGRIDNLFAGIGKRRSRASEHDLKDVLTSIVNGKTPAYRRTQAFGCILTRYVEDTPK